MKLLDMVNLCMTNSDSNVMESRARIGHYPSSMSMKIRHHIDDTKYIDRVIGSCLRKEFYTLKNYKGVGFSAKTIRKMAVGKMIEQEEIDYYKRLGIFHSANIKFIHEYPQLRYPISGEVDAFIVNTEGSNELMGVELKTVYDYYGRKGCIIPTKDTPLYPKDHNILQVMIYLDHYKDAVPEIPVKVFKLVYIDRGSGDTAEHNLSLTITGNLVVSNVQIDRVENPNYNVHKIVERLAELENYLINDILPPKDFTYQYDTDMLENLMILGELNKTDITKLKSGKEIDKGDWQCIAEGTKVLTLNSWKNIEDVTTSDEVLTREGYKKVLKSSSVGIKSNTVKVSPYILSDYIVTDDHEILVASVNSYTSKYRDKAVDNTKFMKIRDIDTTKINYLMYPIDDMYCLNDIESPPSSNLLLLLGNFITKGNYHKNGDGNTYKISMTFGIHDKGNAILVGEAAMSLGATSCNIKELDKVHLVNSKNKISKYLVLRVYGKDIVKLLSDYIEGEYSYNKRFKMNVMMYPNLIQNNLLDIMIKQDGCRLKTGRQDTLVYTTTSKKLALQVQQLFLRNNNIASIVYQNNKKRDIYHVKYYPNAKKRYGFIKNGVLYVRLSKIEYLNKEIECYDLSVKGKQEFLTEGGIVHNCRYCDFYNRCKEDMK